MQVILQRGICTKTTVVQIEGQNKSKYLGEQEGCFFLYKLALIGYDSLL